MKTSFIHSGTKVYAQTFEEGQITEKLLPAVYSLKFSQMSGYYLEKIADAYTVPDRVYGNFTQRSLRVLKSYLNTPKSVGVLSTGIKGAGKSMFSCLLCNEFIAVDRPVIQISDAFGGSSFNDFIESLGDCVLFFDEFAKIYSGAEDESDPQNALLTILDGTSHNKRLHLFTENREHDINSFMLNRPGRIRYHFRHNRLDDRVVAEYCEDRDVPDDVVTDILEATSHISGFSFDILHAIVEEWKLFGGSVKDLISDMNVPNIHSNMVMQLVSIDNLNGGSVDQGSVDNHPLISYHSDDYLRLCFKSSDGRNKSSDLICEDRDINHNLQHWSFLDSDLVSVKGDLWTFEDNSFRAVVRRVDGMAF